MTASNACESSPACDNATDFWWYQQSMSAMVESRLASSSHQQRHGALACLNDTALLRHPPRLLASEWSQAAAAMQRKPGARHMTLLCGAQMHATDQNWMPIERLYLQQVTNEKFCIKSIAFGNAGSAI